MKELNIKKSMELYCEALKILPFGVSSNARLWKGLCSVCGYIGDVSYVPCSIFIKKARGSHIWDVDGNEYIDYRLGFGPVILGHSYAKVHDAVHKIDEDGLIYAFSHPLEIEVARKIKAMVPCAEMVRFCNSGTEATMHAIRVARGFTGKEKIVKFEGHYHGVHDYVLFSVEPPFETREGRSVPASLGIPKAVEDLVITLRWNDFEGIEKVVRNHKDEIAAVITEPVMGNCAAITPREGYLRFLRQLCNENGIVLIFDEVKTGFRLAKGGAQEVYGVTPDLATFAKSMGNGYPVAALVGKEEVMGVIGPTKVVHGGTYSGNPVSLAAADATLRELNKSAFFNRLNKFGRQLMKGIEEVFDDNKISFSINGMPTMFQFLFTKQERVYEYRDLKNCDLDFYTKLQYELLKRGVMIDQDNMEPWFTCYSHTREDLEKTLEALDESITAARREST